MSKDKCIMCGEDTPYDYETHVDMRHGYIEGAGQLCSNCYFKSDRDLLTIPKRMVIDTPNDQELGTKVRQLFYNS